MKIGDQMWLIAEKKQVGKLQKYFNVEGELRAYSLGKTYKQDDVTTDICVICKDVKQYEDIKKKLKFENDIFFPGVCIDVNTRKWFAKAVAKKNNYLILSYLEYMIGINNQATIEREKAKLLKLKRQKKYFEKKISEVNLKINELLVK